MTLDDAQRSIEAAYERRQELSASSVDAPARAAIERAIEALDTGECRVAEPIAGRWQVLAWLKKAVLLYFRIHDNTRHRCGLRTLLRQGAAEIHPGE